MSVFINLSTTLREHFPNYQPAQGLSLDLDGDIRASELAEKIGLPLDDIKIIMLNGRRVAPEATVSNGDRVAFFPAVGGG